MILWLLIVLLLVCFTVNADQSSLESPLASTVSFIRHHQLLPGQESGVTAVHSLTPTRVQLKTRPTAVYRPPYDSIREGADPSNPKEELRWDIVHLNGPDVKDLHTLAQLARMSANAYALPGQKNWYDIDSAWNISFPFGYEDAKDGFRGHVFLSSDNSTIVLAIKGTTLQGATSKKDKFNDNLLFSCCCARVDLSWVFNQVCDCYANNWRCDNTCLSNALIEDSLFYNVGVDLVSDLRTLYPSANIWLVGHSLGGALASLLGTTFGLPAVAFESPGERLAAERLGLRFPKPGLTVTPEAVESPSLIPSISPTTHIYHTGDPIPQGACTGPFSPCAQAGYALETRCHLGKCVIFDTVDRLGWKVDVRTHTIKEVIGILEEWGKPEEGDPDPIGSWEVPDALEELDCVDCYKWEFGEFKNKDYDE
ncbi:Alpha/Beta hydrolase protein [Rhodocollybia butyracea]|uniref:triacylglycerol lipase n=1 Tax=Rhodocollybia butyracea TaxID=206335 RepID=A0A9P5PTU0_9AGAR|nr:Alpha/Beta hydrolase protein [Rhodocollybia butyracea]